MAWYRDGLRFECTRCGKCCTGAPGYVWVSIPEIYRIAEFLGIDDREVMRGFTLSVNQRISLIEKRNGDCIFYDNKLCRIYPVRPAQCSTYPFWRDVVHSPCTWERETASCEGINKGRTHTEEEILELLQQR
jgi:Fe-S-cluster containining protein